MIVILKKEALTKKLVSILIECGLYDSTVLDGEAIENVATQTIPLFSELRGLFGEELVYNKTVIAHVPDRGTIDDFIALCAKDGIDFAHDDVGVVMAFPCAVFVGSV